MEKACISQKLIEAFYVYKQNVDKSFYVPFLSGLLGFPLASRVSPALDAKT